MSDSRWSRILVIEGVPGVGKSTLLDALMRRYVAEAPPRQPRTLVHLTQAHTYGPLVPAEDAGTLTVGENVRHLDAVVQSLEWLAGALTAERRPKLFTLVDTLHLTHCQRPGVVAWDDVAPIDRRLAALGAKLLFVHAGADTLWRRGIVPRRDTQFMTGYAAPRWGPSLESVHGYFVGEQERLRALAARSAMTTLALDLDRPLEQSLDEAHAFWLA
jgi:hypothetical protein